MLTDSSMVSWLIHWLLSAGRCELTTDRHFHVILICTSPPSLDDCFFVGVTVAAQAIPPIPTHFSIAWSVCLSSVCYIHALCLNRPMDLDAILQVHFRGPMTLCFWWGLSSNLGRGDLGEWASNPPAKTCNCKLQLNRKFCAAIWRIQTMRAIPRFTKIFWFLFFSEYCCKQHIMGGSGAATLTIKPVCNDNESDLYQGVTA